MKQANIHRGRRITIAAAVCAFAAASACLCAPAFADGGYRSMHRLYNPNSGEHFYTASDSERDHLVSVGWNSEGEGWVAPESSATPVHRLYNANAGDHHYTASTDERDHLVSVGWSYEGVGWYSDDGRSVPLYRQYNPNAAAGSHNYTTSAGENDMLVSAGWNAEGVGWYGADVRWVGEVGHYEDVVVKAAYDERVTVREDPSKTYCNVCGAELTKETYGSHDKAHALAGEGSGWHSGYDRIIGYETVHHPAVTESRWVVDVPGHWE